MVPVKFPSRTSSSLPRIKSQSQRVEDQHGLAVWDDSDPMRAVKHLGERLAVALRVIDHECAVAVGGQVVDFSTKISCNGGRGRIRVSCDLSIGKPGGLEELGDALTCAEWV